MDAWRFSQTIQSLDLEEDDSDHGSVNNDSNVQLGQIKTLFQARNYKKCAMTCETTLRNVSQSRHPLYGSYLNFYCALSYDALGRGLPLLAPARTTYLSLAEKHYLAAERHLPAPVFSQRVVETSHLSSSSSRSSWRPHSHRSSIESLCSSHSQSTTATSVALAADQHSLGDAAASDYRHESDRGRRLQFSRHVKQSPSACSRSSKATSAGASRYSLSAALEPFAELLGPLSAEMAQYEAADPSFGDDDAESDYSEEDEYRNEMHVHTDRSAWPLANLAPPSHHIHGYNENLVGFRFMLQSHLSSVHRLRQLRPEEPPKIPPLPPRHSLSVLNAPGLSRSLSQKSWSRPQSVVNAKDADEAASAEEKRRRRQERMKAWAEQKEKGYKRFNAERYQELARAALAEL